MSATSSYAGVGTSHLSSALEDDGPYTFHGVALGSGDITIGRSGIKKLWTEEALRAAAETLAGQELVRDHKNNTEGVIGKVTKSSFKEGVGVLYEAEIASHYEEQAQDIKAGLLDVSPRIYHDPVEELDEDEETGALIIDEDSIHGFDNLSTVSSGASPSNTAEFGEAAAMAEGPKGETVAVMEQGGPRPEASELREHFDSEENRTHPDMTSQPRSDMDDTPEWEDGDMVRWQVEPDLFGEIVHVDKKKNIAMVEIMGREDGGFTSTGFTITAGFSDIRPMNMPESKADMSGHSEDEDEDEEDEMSESDNGEDAELDGESEQDDDTEELQTDMTVHEPEWSSTADKEWNKPNLEDFTDDSWEDLSQDEKSSIGDHFLVSSSGFPADAFGDMSLPVVEPDGTLNLNALSNAKSRAGQVTGLGGDTLDRVENLIDRLANDNFDEASFGEDEEESSSGEQEDKTITVATLSDDDPETASTDRIAAFRIN